MVSPTFTKPTAISCLGASRTLAVGVPNHLRRAERPRNLHTSRLAPLLDKHPDKTFIGRIERGFDFLGYHFGPDGLVVAESTVQNFVARAIRLYEQERERPEGPSALGMYVRRWVGWAKCGRMVEMLRKQSVSDLAFALRRSTLR